MFVRSDVGEGVLIDVAAGYNREKRVGVSCFKLYQEFRRRLVRVM